MVLNKKDVIDFSYQAWCLKVTKFCNFQHPQLLSRHSTALGGRPKPENLDNHDIYETHQKFSFSFRICDTLNVRTQFITGCDIHWCKVSPHLYYSAKEFLFIYIRLQY